MNAKLQIGTRGLKTELTGRIALRRGGAHWAVGQLKEEKKKKKKNRKEEEEKKKRGKKEE
jgi:hypothetical protein